MWKEFIATEQIRIEKMYTLFEARYENGYSFHGETHDFWECMYVKSGSVCVSGNERVYHLKQGEIIFHKPLELHKFFVDCDEGCDLLIFSFDMIGEKVEYYKNKVFKLKAEQDRIVQQFLLFLHRGLSSCDEAYDSVFYYLNEAEENPVRLQLITLYVAQILLSLCEDYKTLKTLDCFDAEVFKRAVEFMKENISSQLSIKEIAVYCQVSQTVLKSIFTKYGGMGVHKYFLTLKISAAARALAKGMSVTKAADSYGFKSQAYFSAAFKRETGLSPSEYAKTNI